MRALCWHGKGDVRCDTVPDPKIEHSPQEMVKGTTMRSPFLRPARLSEPTSTTSPMVSWPSTSPDFIVGM